MKWQGVIPINVAKQKIESKKDKSNVTFNVRGQYNKVSNFSFLQNEYRRE